MRARRPAVGLVLLLVILVGACTGAEPARPEQSATPSPEPLDYHAALARIPLDGVPERPLYWDNEEMARTAEEIQLVAVARHWKALEHMLIYSEVPRREEDLALLYLLATEERAEPVDQHHRSVFGTNTDPTVGPQWIRVIDVDRQAQPPTVTICIDKGYHTRVSQGGGVEVFREETRALLIVYSLVEEPVPGLGPRWKVSHERWYAGDDYPEPNTGPDRECKQWANHDLTDVPDS